MHTKFSPHAGLHIVVGSSFGDEGKGATVSYLCKQVSPDFVLRPNGGPQATHTAFGLDRGEGPVRHICGTFSAGSVWNIPTKVGDNAFFNPEAAKNEAESLIGKGLEPRLFVRKSWLIFPQDSLLNRFYETLRGEGRHGSCGVGLWEAILRGEEGVFAKITAHQARDFQHLSEVWQRASGNMLEKMKFALLNFCGKESDREIGREIFENAKDWAKNEDRVEEYYESIWASCGKASEAGGLGLAGFAEMGDLSAHNFETVVSETSQGLLLDERRMEYYPHITASKTVGAATLLDPLVRSNNLKVRSLYYATRPYITRHGAGPMGQAAIGPLWEPGGWTCPTNTYNKWQGSIRAEEMNWRTFRDRVCQDAESTLRIAGQIPDSVTLVVSLTCMDEVQEWGSSMPYSPVYRPNDLGSRTWIPTAELPERLKKFMNENAYGLKWEVLNLNGLANEGRFV